MWRTGLVAPRHVGSSRTWARTHVPCIGRQILNPCTTREAPQVTFMEHLFYDGEDARWSCIHVCQLQTLNQTLNPADFKTQRSTHLKRTLSSSLCLVKPFLQTSNPNSNAISSKSPYHGRLRRVPSKLFKQLLHINASDINHMQPMASLGSLHPRELHTL